MKVNLNNYKCIFWEYLQSLLYTLFLIPLILPNLYNELLKKADLNGLKALEASLIRLNELINDMANQFADRVENDKAHKLLAKHSLCKIHTAFLSAHAY